MKEQFFCPLECAPAGGVTVGHSVTLIHIAHMMVIIHHNLRLYGFPLSLQKLPSAGAIRILFNMHMSLLSHHSIAVKSVLVLTRMFPLFIFVVFGFRSRGMPFLFGLTVPQQ